MRNISLTMKVLLILFIFCSVYNIKAQTEWTFVYYEKYPHVVWGCPYQNCSGQSGLLPQTLIAYASDYFYYTPNNIIHHLDKSFFATFKSGKLMGGNFETQSCRFKTWGYGTIKNDNVGVSCNNSTDTLTVEFSEAAFGKKMVLFGKYPQTFTVTESGRHPYFVNLDPTYNDQGEVTSNGIKTVYLSGKKINGLSVKSTDPTYAFSIDSISVNRIPGQGSTPSSGNNPPPDYCNATSIPRPAPQNLSAYNWTMHAEVSDTDGLVLSDIRLKGRLMAERISIPYYQITTNQATSQRGELRPDDSSGNLRSRLIYYYADTNDERLIIKAIYAIDNISGEPSSCLYITQSYEFLKEGVYGFCSPPAPIGYTLPCNKWRALVNYDFKGNSSETLESLNVAQRNHFKVNGYGKNSVGLFKDCDVSLFSTSLGCTFPLGGGSGAIFENKINPLFSEIYSPVIVNGKATKRWDNVHQTYLSSVSEPLDNIPSSDFTAAGCPECFHTHWRWGKHFGHEFNNGEPFLPSGSNQDQSIGIVKYRQGEEHPNNLFDLLSFTNPEPIRYRLTGIDLLERNHFNYTKPEEVVYWISATGRKKSDELLGYYSFFIPSEAGVDRMITPDSLYSGGFKQEKSDSLTGQDAPTSITYGFVYTDGPTRYTERDPNTIAQLPNGYVQYNSVAYDIRTEAAVSGPHTTTFNIPSVTDQTTFDSLRILHSEPDPFDPTMAVWVDRTILSPNTPAPDFVNRNLSVKVNEIGPFVIARLVNPPAPNTNVADLSVTVTESADPVTAGNNLIYTINVTNNGPNTATGAALSNGLSPDVNFVSADGGQRFCNHINGTVLCNLDTIASGATITVTITVKPNEGQIRFPAEGKSIVNTVFVIANENDPNENDNSVSESTLAMPNPNAPPTAEIQSPARNAIFSNPAIFSVIVGATDSNGTIAQVELFLDGESAGNGTAIEAGKYAINLNNIDYGEHTLIAVATDSGGRKAVSDAVGFFVNGPVIVTLDNPEENTLFGRPANIALTATAANESGTVALVEFTVNGALLGNGVLSGTNQYNFIWNNAPTGIHSIRTIATDGNGVKSYSQDAKIYVTNNPTVNITNPLNGASYPKNTSIIFSANAQDFDGYVSKVEFFRNGTQSLGTAAIVQGSRFDLNWQYAPVGTHLITAVATDDWGKTSVSSPVSVTVSNNPPNVSLTNPANGATYNAPTTINLSANASDTDGSIWYVEFFDGTNLIGQSYSAPFDFTWDNAFAGNHILTAKATDDDGAVSVSSPVTITVNAVGDALLVVGNTTLSAVDTAIKTRLQTLGLNVVVKSASAAVSADATGKLVVVISDSVSPTSVNTKFKTVAILVVTLDPQLWVI